MKGIASVLAVATVFIGLWTLIATHFLAREGGGLIHKTKIPTFMKEL